MSVGKEQGYGKNQMIAEELHESEKDGKGSEWQRQNR